jgi:hypothetical protein
VTRSVQRVQLQRRTNLLSVTGDLLLKCEADFRFFTTTAPILGRCCFRQQVAATPCVAPVWDTCKASVGHGGPGLGPRIGADGPAIVTLRAASLLDAR